MWVMSSELPPDRGPPSLAPLAPEEVRAYSEAFARVLHPRWILHPHALPLVELFRQVRVTRGPQGQAPFRKLTKEHMLEVFAGNPDFHVEDVLDPESGGLQTWVRVTEGPRWCGVCAADGTVAGARHDRHEAACRAREAAALF